MRQVYCTFRIVGFHRWKDAPAMSAFLRSNHRHEFHFKVAIEVYHADREIEFITLKSDCIRLLHGSFDHDVDSNFIFEERSCEQIADGLMIALSGRDPYIWLHPDIRVARQIIVEVSEDGENGAIVSRL